MADNHQHQSSGSAPVIPAPVPTQDAAMLQSLIQLLLSERQDAMLEKQEKIRVFQEKEKQRRINAEQNIADRKASQGLCTHKKNQKGIRGPKVDYAVSYHTFTSSESYIRCLICGMKWKNTDTAEYLVRRGEKVPNHTGLGWKEAFKMVDESTNTATSSEVQLSTRPVEYAKPDFKTDPRASEI